ncbi:MAG: NADH-quinone oxidoreductase subunit G [Actinobacteria bacterium]|nr:NADH-quinone oxidoreductase subunit G [Actinomycetota bacterium]HRV65379.1 NADH-quinone oxidoreductase subunit G [Candidatus Nanopelagicales bacterium]
MTVSDPDSSEMTVPEGHVAFSIDGVSMTAEKGTLIIRAAEQLGIEIPRFCDHPLLDPVAACRMCLIEIEGQPKPQPACAIPVADNMIVRTQRTSKVADEAQRGVMEFLLLNHPLDCPICDKGGECPLQNQAMTAGRSETRFEGPKRTFPKPINISAQILLDRERCVSCARCTRFADEIAGDAFIDLLERGAQQQVGISQDTPFDSYFAGNTVQICPVGALTNARYRFRARPFDLVSVPTICEHCASGCAMRTDVRRGEVQRRLAGDDPEVNEEWNCDKGRFGFTYLTEDRITHPMVRDEVGRLVPASWPEALGIAADALAAAAGSAAVLVGGRLTAEDAQAYSTFARTVLKTDDVDFRARPSSDEEAAFLTSTIAGTFGPTYSDLDVAPAVVLVAFEPEEESPIVFLRLRKAVTKGSTKVFAVAPWASPGLSKLDATVLAAGPGQEIAAMSGSEELMQALSQPGAVLMVGERAATSQGLLSWLAATAAQTGAHLAWVPRRAGERGALDAGLLPGAAPAMWNGETGVGFAGVIERLVAAAQPQEALVPVADEAVADELQQETADVDEEPEPPYRALLVAGFDPMDVPDGAALVAGFEQVPCVVALGTHHNDATRAADVVFPVAAVTEKAGSFTDWEGRRRPFPQVFRESLILTDASVLSAISDEMLLEPQDEPIALGAMAQSRPAAPRLSPAEPARLAPGEAVLATWHQLLDDGSMQAGEPYMAATARPPVVRVSPANASDLGISDGDPVTVTGDIGSLTLPALVTDMPSGIVWVPMNSGTNVVSALGVASGDTVRVSVGRVS